MTRMLLALLPAVACLAQIEREELEAPYARIHFGKDLGREDRRREHSFLLPPPVHRRRPPLPDIESQVPLLAAADFRVRYPAHRRVVRELKAALDAQPLGVRSTLAAIRRRVEAAAGSAASAEAVRRLEQVLTEVRAHARAAHDYACLCRARCPNGSPVADEFYADWDGERCTFADWVHDSMAFNCGRPGVTRPRFPPAEDFPREASCRFIPNPDASGLLYP